MIGFRLDPDLSAAVLDDLFAYGQTDALSRVFRAEMQPLKDNKNMFCLFGHNPDTVIAHTEQPFRGSVLGPHRYHRWFFSAELDRVPNQILENLRQVRALPPDHRQGAVCDPRAALSNRGTESQQHLFHHRLAINLLACGAISSDSRKSQ